MKNRNTAAFLSIAFAVGIVVLPILAERLPGLRGRLAFARAANAVDLGTGNADQLLREAERLFDKPKQELDYWHVRLKMALKSDPDTALEVLVDAVRSNEKFVTLASTAYWHHDKQRDYENALNALLLLYSKVEVDVDGKLIAANQISYLRALSRVDLVAALEDMNHVVKEAPSQWEYRDTRAWVLYELGKYPEALEDANAAVKQSVSSLQDSETGLWNQIVNWASGTPQPASADGLLTIQEANKLLWSVGVVRYHRGKILEAMGMKAEAEADWAWLAERKLPADDRLH